MDNQTILLAAEIAQSGDPQVVAAIGAGIAARMAQDAAAQAANMAFWTLVVQTIGSLGTAWIVFKGHQLSKNVQLIEKNGNSMREQLVAATDKFARQEGRQKGNLEGREQQKQEAAAKERLEP